MSESTEPAAAEETVQEQEVQKENQPEEAVHAEIEAAAAETACQEKQKEEEVEVDVTEHEPEVLRKENVQDEDQDHSELDNEQLHEQQAEENQDKPLEVSQDTMQLPVVSMSQGAIEDEEMPSMISISSPSRIDDSEVNLKLGDNKSSVDMKEYNSKTSPKKEEDDDSDSVCVIDDDDDEEEDRSSFDEEDENSSYQEEESDEMDTDDKYSRRRGRVERSREEIDEEDDEEDEEDDEEEEGDYDDDDSEPHYSDGGSDDIAVRHSNGLSKHHKERSASLQDLSRIKEQVVRSKQNVNPFSQKARFERNQINSEQRPQGKPYAHVESKVKKYIMDMTEQRRMSVERRRKAQEEARQKNQEIIESQPRRNEEVATTCKTIKEYSEKTLKEVAECEENEEIYALQQRVENGDLSIIPRRSLGNGEPVQRQEEMDVDPIAVEEYSNDEKSDKINGTVLNENQNDFVPERKGILRRENCSPKPVLNGEGPSIVCDLRTLSYDEYMKGPVSKDDNEVVIDSESITKDAQDVQKFNNNETDTACIFRIENVTSNYYSEEKEMTDSVMMVNQSTETYYEENSELLSQVATLQSQLEERNIQFSGLSEAYRKVISENLAMKMELENLRKKTMQYEEKEKQEKKVIAVQTEGLVSNLNMPIIEVDEEQQQIDPKLAPSMISTASSQWTDGTNSVSYSMDQPPNLTTALNSDESTNIQGKTPAKHKNAFSRAFMTSSRILQTLSSITHGKGKSDKHGNKRSKTSVAKRAAEPTVENEKAQTTEPEQTKSRKRKATDTMEISSSAQPFKIPHMSTSDWEKQAASTPEPPVINIEDADEKSANENSEENSDDEEEIQELDDDVKVFVYPEDESGKEHSFLIQAKEVTSNPKPGVRECGPYLLGNVEVFMTEMNGTINIWGKELSQGSTNQNVEELNTSTRSKDLKDGFRWQSTPRIFKNQGSSSSNKKSRVSPKSAHHHQQRHACNASNTLVECENCSAHSHRLSWPSCNRSMHENQHTCCHPIFRVEDNHCGCAHKERRPYATACCNTQKFVDARRFSMPSLYHDNCCNHHNHYTAPAHEESCRHHASVRRNSFNGEEDNDSNDEENVQYTSKAHHSLNENSPHSCNNAKLPVPPGSTSRRASSGNCSDHSTGQNESDPLIFQKPISEAPEVRKRRLSGRKVRGLLLDLLKGCGDCRTPINKTTNMSMYGPSTSAQMRDDYQPNQMSCPSRANEKSNSNETVVGRTSRVCSLCRNRSDKTAEIEAQLEFFRIEMEKLRSRSDTLHDMLDTLRTEDTN